jgi:cation diffusion facilitator CzcD-associated flavoprotein CzcO
MDADYLRWYRRVMGVDVRNRHGVTGMHPRADGPACAWTWRRGRTAALHACWPGRVVLATGRDGLGGPAMPDWVDALPARRWAHSSDDLGLRPPQAASAWPSSARRLGHGQRRDRAGSRRARVDLLVRRADLPRVNKGKGAAAPAWRTALDLPDALEVALPPLHQRAQVPPPHGSTLRVSGHANAFFNFGCPILSITPPASQGEAMRVRTPKGDFEFDFLIVSTGFKVDWPNRPEFADIAAHVRTWGDRFVPAPGDEDQELADSPDLGPAFEFQERVPGECPGLARIHCFCYPAALSHGTVSGDIPAISDGARRLASGIASLFYREDFDHHYANLEAYAEPELFGDEWTPALPPQERN